jgi:DNA-binding NarL/FixJ family response regulator
MAPCPGPRSPIDVVHGSSPTAKSQRPSPLTEELSPSELRVLRYLPTNPVQAEIASEHRLLYTRNTHVLNIYPKLQARDRFSAVLAWSSLVLVRSTVTARDVQAQTTTRIMKIR